MTALNEPFLSPYEEARRDGAEAMRERAAKLVEELTEDKLTAAAIRRLEVE